MRGRFLLPLGLALLSGGALAESRGRLVFAAPSARVAAHARASASEDIEPIRVRHSAPAGCPSHDEFTHRLLSRVPRSRLAASNELARVITVEIVPVGEDVAGEARVLLAGKSAPNQLAAAGRCDAVVEQLATFTAKLLAPNHQPVSLKPTATRLNERLPPNPYLTWKGPLAEPLPRNPYLAWQGQVAERLPLNPYLAWNKLGAVVHTPLEYADLEPMPARNPYRW